jgi:hypothetical protein
MSTDTILVILTGTVQNYEKQPLQKTGIDR